MGDSMRALFIVLCVRPNLPLGVFRKNMYPFRFGVAVLAATLLLNTLHAQEPGPLTNQRIYELVAAGVSTSEVIRVIASAKEVDFTLQPAYIDALMKAGVTDEVIRAMAARQHGQPLIEKSRISARSAADPPQLRSEHAVANQAANGSSNFSEISEVGAYYQSGDHWVEMMPEVVNWQTGGVVKNVASVGIVKGDLNGRLRYAHSHLKISNPLELLVYTPEGTQITEYQLIRLRTHHNAREFRTVTGGVFHVSGGSQRDTLAFSSQHIAARTWTIALNDLQPGEYGLLPPGVEARSASAQLGKMFTFTVNE
jgi:hypothetical protein